MPHVLYNLPLVPHIGVNAACTILSPPSAAYRRQYIESALVQIMTCRLFGAKPLSKPMLAYCHLGTNFSENLIKIQNFSFIKSHLKISSAKRRQFCPGEDELTKFYRFSNQPFVCFHSSHISGLN